MNSVGNYTISGESSLSGVQSFDSLCIAPSNVQKVLAKTPKWLYCGNVLDARSSLMSIRGRRARWVCISLYRRALDTAIPPASCSFPVFNRSCSIARRAHATPTSGHNSAQPSQRDTSGISKDAPVVHSRPPALTRPFSPCRVPALAGWRETHFS